jgi:hypothetical protein
MTTTLYAEVAMLIVRLLLERSSVYTLLLTNPRTYELQIHDLGTHKPQNTKGHHRLDSILQLTSCRQSLFPCVKGTVWRHAAVGEVAGARDVSPLLEQAAVVASQARQRSCRGLQQRSSLQR